MESNPMKKMYGISYDNFRIYKKRKENHLFSKNEKKTIPPLNGDDNGSDQYEIYMHQCKPDTCAERVFDFRPV